jgi:hypothetical protein|tara:strand:- start:38 stop:838 length:801 start_codon:yes stop_codon:yes gene_type:complete
MNPRKQALENLVAPFKKFAAKYDPKQLPDQAKTIAKDFTASMKGINEMAKAMRGAMLMQTINQNVSPAHVEAFINELYDTFTGEDTARAITQLVHAQEIPTLPSKAAAKLDKLKDPKFAAPLAVALKQAAQRGAIDKAIDMAKQGVAKAPGANPMHIMIANSVLDNVGMVMNQAKDLDMKQVVTLVQNAANVIPFKVVEDQLDGALANVDKDTVQGALDQVRAQLPTAKSIADAYGAELQKLNAKVTGKKPSNDDDKFKGPDKFGF